MKHSADVSKKNAIDDLDQKDEANRWNQWWEQAQWALKLITDTESKKRSIGFQALSTLLKSDYIPPGAAELVSTVTRVMKDLEPEIEKMAAAEAVIENIEKIEKVAAAEAVIEEIEKIEKVAADEAATIVALYEALIEERLSSHPDEKEEDEREEEES